MTTTRGTKEWKALNWKTALTRQLTLTPLLLPPSPRTTLVTSTSSLRNRWSADRSSANRALIPFGGIKMIEGSCKAYNRELDPMIKKIFTEYRKTHNQGVFDVYTPDILRCRNPVSYRSARCLWPWSYHR
ncbi:pyruvate formate lyase family protein [Escherichia coli]